MSSAIHSHKKKNNCLLLASFQWFRCTTSYQLHYKLAFCKTKLPLEQPAMFYSLIPGHLICSNKYVLMWQCFPYASEYVLGSCFLYNSECFSHVFSCFLALVCFVPTESKEVYKRQVMSITCIAMGISFLGTLCMALYCRNKWVDLRINQSLSCSPEHIIWKKGTI